MATKEFLCKANLPSPSSPACIAQHHGYSQQNSSAAAPSAASDLDATGIFFPHKLALPQLQYSAFDWELLAIHNSIRHFCYMFKVRDFVILYRS